MTWRIVVLAVLGLVVVRLAMLVRAVACGKLPWTRLLLPSIVVVEGVGLAGHGLWQVRLGTAVALEVTFVVVAIRALRREGGALPEVSIAHALEALVPTMVARLAAIEIVIIGLAARFVFGGWRRPPPIGFTYHRDNGLRMMLPILPLLAIGDVLLLELVILPHAALWLRIVVHVLAAYGVVWLIGLYASARARPHRLVDGRLELHRGVLRRVAVDVAQVASVAPLPSFADDWKKRAYLKGTTRLDLGAAHVLELTLHDGTRLVVGVDDPAAFTAAL